MIQYPVFPTALPSFKVYGCISILSHHFPKGNNFRDFLLFFPGWQSFENGSSLLQERNCKKFSLLKGPVLGFVSNTCTENSKKKLTVSKV